LREASASKPSMKCRKRIRRCQNRGLTLPPGSARGSPEFCLSGIRHVGGAKLNQACMGLSMSILFTDASPLIDAIQDVPRGAHQRAQNHRAACLYSADANRPDHDADTHRRRSSGAAGPFSSAAWKPCLVSGHRHLGSLTEPAIIKLSAPKADTHSPVTLLATRRPPTPRRLSPGATAQ
jgi:hypothetical protein